MPEQKSFYEVDYIIDVSERRLDQYTQAYLKTLERLTSILLIYSGISIFLIPLVIDIIKGEMKSWFLLSCFIVFVVLFLISVYYTIRLLFPVDLAYLRGPKIYKMCRKTHSSPQRGWDVRHKGVNLEIKYIGGQCQALPHQLSRQSSHPTKIHADTNIAYGVYRCATAKVGECFPV